MTEIRDTEALDLLRARKLLALFDGGDEDQWDYTSDIVKERFLTDARAIRLADEAAGLRIVPEEPTRDMLNAGYEAVDSDIGGDWIGKVIIQTDVGKRVLRAMLAASPFAGK